MAGNQNSGKKRSTAAAGTTSGKRKVSGTKARSSTGGRRKTGSGKTASGRRKSSGTGKQEQSYTEPVMDEIRLIIILAVCVLILLSVFGLGGRVGDRAAYVFFGIFGLMAYALPFVLFIGIAFHMSNKESRLAHIKLTAGIVFMVMVMALITLSDAAFDGTGDILDGYLSSAASRDGGGLIGYSLSWLLYSAFGRIGSTVIFVCIMLISGVLVTGRRIFVRLGQLMLRGCSVLRDRLADWQEKRAEERMRREQEDEAPEEDMEENWETDGKDGEPEVVYKKRPKGRKKAAVPNIILPDPAAGPDSASVTGSEGVSDSAVVTISPAAADMDASAAMPSVSDVSSAAIALYVSDSSSSVPADSHRIADARAAASGDETADSGTLFTKAHLDRFDHGQAVEPLHIQVPEFMRGGKIHVSTMERPKTEQPSGSENAVRTSLTIDDLDLEIKGLDGDTDTEAAEAAAAIEAAGTATAEMPAKQALFANLDEDLAELRRSMTADQDASEKEPASDQADAAGKSGRHAASGSRMKTASDEDADMPEIIEEEIEKYEFPTLALLDKGTGSGGQQSAASLKQTALKLQQTFDSFGVGVQVTNVSCGPAVTRYELQPDQGVKVSRIVSLSDDIKLNLAVADIRIEAPIPGKAAVGIEVPNTHKEMVRLRDLLESDKVKRTDSRLAFAVGKDIGGQTVVADIEKMPHLLIAGATGSGKSVCINTIIMSILYRADPNEVKMIMIDPKVVELNVYNGLPHLLIPVVTEPKKAAGALNWAVSTMMERYNAFAEIGARDIKSYNARIERISQDGMETKRKMPQILIIIDELADLMMVAQSEVEDAICRLAQLARAAGIHLIIATQRPSVNVITGLIKANVPSRIAFSVSSGVDSRTILDMNGAEKLLGNGDMLFYPQGYQKPVRVQGAFVSDSEIGRVTEFIRSHMSSQPVYSEAVTKSIETSVTAIGNGASSANSERDIYFEEAGRFVIEKEKASIGMLQRVYKIGFNRAARIMDQLCDAGVVGPEIGTKPRQIKMTLEAFEDFLKQS